MPLRLVLPLLCCLFLCTCDRAAEMEDVNADLNPAGTVVPDAETAVGKFVANPQPVAKRDVLTLAVGSPAPDFTLMSVDGRYKSLADYADAKVLTLVFTANHCPTAQAYEQRLMDYQRDYADRGVTVVAISPNSPLGLLYQELGYSDLGDEYEEMQVRHRDAKYNFDYLYDGDDHAASLLYGPVATPHVFVLDADRTLRYTGRLDATELPGTTNAEDLRLATDELLAGKPLSQPTTKTFGCSTKWAWKTEFKEQVQQEWEAKPVTLEELTISDVPALLRNDSENLRLINLWATWCGPCVLEYPDFLVTQRMYGQRNFEFVSISMDKPDQGEKALKFLKKVQSPVRNLHFTGADKYELIEAIDPDWNGAIPYTILVAPGGEVVWRHQAEVDFLEMRRAIVEHELMGRYF